MKQPNLTSARSQQTCSKAIVEEKRYSASICVSNQGGGINFCYDGGSRSMEEHLSHNQNPVLKCWTHNQSIKKADIRRCLWQGDCPLASLPRVLIVTRLPKSQGWGGIDPGAERSRRRRLRQQIQRPAKVVGRLGSRSPNCHGRRRPVFWGEMDGFFLETADGTT